MDMLPKKLIPGSSALHLEVFASQQFQIVLKDFATCGRIDRSFLNEQSVSERSVEHRVVQKDGATDDGDHQEKTDQRRHKRRFRFRLIGATQWSMGLVVVR